MLCKEEEDNDKPEREAKRPHEERRIALLSGDAVARAGRAREGGRRAYARESLTDAEKRRQPVYDQLLDSISGQKSQGKSG